VHAGLSDVMATIRGVGARVGQPAGAEALAARIERDLAAVRARVAGRPRPLTMMVFEREAGQLRNIWASGGLGFLHDMLTMAGGENVFDTVQRESVTVGLETLMASPPEVIVELHYGRHYPPAELATEREAWNRLTTLGAVRQNRVYLLAGEEFVVPGPRVALATERIARVLHPEAFAGGKRR
jgi:iron complex transport system substrate-binding protein